MDKADEPTTKLWERVIKCRLSIGTSVSENQFGFLCIEDILLEAILLIRQLIEWH